MDGWIHLLIRNFRILRHGQLPLPDGVLQLLRLQPQLLLRFRHLLQQQQQQQQSINQSQFNPTSTTTITKTKEQRHTESGCLPWRALPSPVSCNGGSFPGLWCAGSSRCRSAPGSSAPSTAPCSAARTHSAVPAILEQKPARKQTG